jgi:GTP cyclohydrolase II
MSTPVGSTPTTPPPGQQSSIAHWDRTHRFLPQRSLSQVSLSNVSIPPSPLFLPSQGPGHYAGGTSSPLLPSAPLTPSHLPALPTVDCLVRARIPTTSGTEIWLHLYTNTFDNKEHLAIVFGGRIRSTNLDSVRPGETEMDRMIRGAYTGRLYPGRTDSYDPKATLEEVTASDIPLVRIHSECYTGETAWSARCDCGEQLDEAARLMSEAGEGVIVYLRQEGRGIGLGEKLKYNSSSVQIDIRAYNLQDLGNDTVQANLLLHHPADARSYGVATSILVDLNIPRIALLTNNPDKIIAVEGPHKEVRVEKRVRMIPKAWRGEVGVEGKEVGEYLKTKVLSYFSLS